MRAQGLEPYDAAITGGWIHAMAGARAETMMNTSASVMAGDILEWLPDAYALAEAAR
jgi:NAD(P)H-hydrate repair Nnr-like enzyme with NAD(P)H-hydrate dehydratase domain